MRVVVLRLQLDDEPSRRDVAVVERLMELTERRLSSGLGPRFYLGTHEAPDGQDLGPPSEAPK